MFMFMFMFVFMFMFMAWCKHAAATRRMRR
jgi:hypothetical protein